MDHSPDPLTRLSLEQLQEMATPTRTLQSVHCNRATIQLHARHEDCENGPTSVDLLMVDMLEEGEVESTQPYIRRLKVNRTPLAIDLGWVERPGTIFIENRAGQRNKGKLSDDEWKLYQEETKGMNLFVHAGKGGEPIQVRPGKFTMVEFREDANWEQIKISGNGEFPATITIYPR